MSCWVDLDTMACNSFFSCDSKCLAVSGILFSIAKHSTSITMVCTGPSLKSASLGSSRISCDTYRGAVFLVTNNKEIIELRCVPESHLQMPVGGVLDLILRVHPRIACYFDPCSKERAQTALMLGYGLALSTALVTNANCSVLCTSPWSAVPSQGFRVGNL